MLCFKNKYNISYIWFDVFFPFYLKDEIFVDFTICWFLDSEIKRGQDFSLVHFPLIRLEAVFRFQKEFEILTPTPQKFINLSFISNEKKKEMALCQFEE